MWRVEDGKEMATMEANGVRCLVVSKDDRWIAAGTSEGDVLVWNAKTYKKIFSQREEKRRDRDYNAINGVDFSPDSTRLVSASWNGTASIWDIATGKRVQTLQHVDWVTAAKYSPQGDRIATAIHNSVRVWDSNDGRLLVKTTVGYSLTNTCLWSNNHLFVASGDKIEQFDASTGSVVFEWSVAETTHSSCIALPKHGEFIAYSTTSTVTFCDTATHTQRGLIQHHQDIRSIAFSPDDRFLAIVGEDGKITIHSLFPIVVSILFHWIVVHLNNFLAPIILP